ncbi:MAG: P1 family peptidase, partial [Bryobacteraceae bacterium]
GADGTVLAGSTAPADAPAFAVDAPFEEEVAPGNTTLVVVATNAAISKVEATKLAQFASLGVARTISPVNTMSDGDLVVALSLGNAKAPVDALGVAAAEAVSESILRAVRLAPSLGGLPGLKK